MEVPQLDLEYRRLELVEPRIETLDLIVVLDPRAVVPEHTHLLDESRVVPCHRPGIAERTQIFPWVKAPRGQVGEVFQPVRRLL